jgi:hypothetical protein
MKNVEAPADLSKKSAAIWRDIVVTRCRSAERRALLGEALRALDRADSARALAERDGLIQRSRKSGIRRLHPALRIEETDRRRFQRLWLALNLVFDPVVDGRVE